MQVSNVRVTGYCNSNDAGALAFDIITYDNKKQ